MAQGNMMIKDTLTTLVPFIHLFDDFMNLRCTCKRYNELLRPLTAGMCDKFVTKEVKIPRITAAAASALVAKGSDKAGTHWNIEVVSRSPKDSTKLHGDQSTYFLEWQHEPGFEELRNYITKNTSDSEYQTSQTLKQSEYPNAVDFILRMLQKHGIALQSIHYSNGTKHGAEKRWRIEKGKQQMAGTANWKYGKKDGLEESFDINNVLEYRCNFKDGNKDGEEYRVTFNEVFRCNYRNGKAYGELTWRNKVDNKKSVVVNYNENGQMHGIVEKWNQKGDPIYKAQWVNGKRIEQVHIPPPDVSNAVVPK